MWHGNCVVSVARNQQLMIDALISVRKQVESERINACTEDIVEFDPEGDDNSAIPVTISSSATATSTATSASDTTVAAFVESSAVCNSNDSLEVVVAIPARFTEEESQLLLECTNDTDYLAKATTRITKGDRVLRKPRVKWDKIEAVFKAKKNNTTIFGRTKNRLENYCKETRKRKSENDAELKKKQFDYG